MKKLILVIILALILTLGYVPPVKAALPGPPQSIEIQPNHLYFIRGNIVPALKELAKKGRIDSLEPIYTKDFSSMDLVGIFVFLTPNPKQKSEANNDLAFSGNES
jgi:hypothetical protein